MIYLGGGGSEIDEELIWLRAFKQGQRVIIWPFAMPPHRWKGTLEWMRGALARKGGGFTSVSLGLEEPDFGLRVADIVAITGGNTFELLVFLQKHDLVSGLRKFVNRGGEVYGGSAGAVIMGADIAIIDAATGGQDENTMNLDDTNGLDAVHGSVIYPHFEADQASWREYCESWARDRGVTVLGIPEKCGVAVERDGRAVNAGPADVFVFRPDGTMVQVKRDDALPI